MLKNPINRKNALREVAAAGTLAGVNVGDLADDVLGSRREKMALTRRIDIDKIVIDESIQVRVGGLDEDHLATLIAVLQNAGSIEEPVVVFYDGDRYLLADGFHRMAAFWEVGIGLVQADVREGGYEAALEYAEEANLRHGLSLSNEDKRAILARRWERGHPWTRASYREIARQLGVHHDTIGKWLKELTGGNPPVGREVVGGDGRVYKTENIVEANRERKAVSGDVQADREWIEHAKRQLREEIAGLEGRDLSVANRVRLEKASAELALLETAGDNYVLRRESARNLTPSPSPKERGENVFEPGSGSVPYVEPEELEVIMDREWRAMEPEVTREIRKIHDEDYRDLPDWLRQMLTQCMYMERTQPANMSYERVIDIEVGLLEVQDRISSYLRVIEEARVRWENGEAE